MRLPPFSLWGSSLALAVASLAPRIVLAEGADPAAAPPPATSAAPAAAPPPATSAAPTAAPAPAPTAAPAPGANAGDAVDLTGATPPPPPPPASNDNPYIPVFPERRSGFLLGATGGLVLTSASGTRVKYSLRDQVADPGVAPGYGGLVFIGGVLTDWFSFHLGGGMSSATKGDLNISGTNFIIGVETWPLFFKGGHLRNLGVGLDFGTGTAKIVNKNDSIDIRAEGGGFSMIRASLFYDASVLWRLNLGPAVAYEYRTTETYTEHLVTLGARFAIYSGP